MAHLSEAGDSPPDLTRREATNEARPTSVWLLVGLVLIAVNLRPAIVAVAPLLVTIRRSTGISGAAAGLLTSLPVLCFGLLSLLAPQVSRRIGLERSLWLALLILDAGIALRFAPSLLFLFLGTAAIGGGVALGNVLVPALIRRDFPSRVGVVTGLYATALTFGGACAAALTVPLMLATGVGWRTALAFWLLPALVATLMWVRQLGLHSLPDSVRAPRLAVWRQRLAWDVTFFMGMQSLVYFALTAWLPTIFIEHGVSTAEAAGLLGLATFMGIPAALAVSVLVGRSRTQRLLVILITGLVAGAVVGLLVAPAHLRYLWTVMFGLAQGGALALALTMIGLRSGDSQQASELSSMAQSIGYLLAAGGPVALGAARDISGGWTLPLLILLGVLLVQLVAGLGAGRNLQLSQQQRA